VIRTPTVLIFGAGVSFAYGFPLGRQLLLNTANNLRSPTPVLQSIKDCGFDDSFIGRFSGELIESMQPSIDAFLERQPSYSEIGKAAIVAALIPSEAKQRLTSRDDLRLYEHLWSKLTGHVGTYPGNRLGVVTFNYDRSFEQFLRFVLVASHFSASSFIR
jgi:hypothetical protein